MPSLFDYSDDPSDGLSDEGDDTDPSYLDRVLGDGPPANVLQASAPAPDLTQSAPPTAPNLGMPSASSSTGLLGRIGAAITHGVQNAGNALLPSPSTALDPYISPADVSRARRSALFDFSTRMLEASSPSNGRPAPGFGAALGSAIDAARSGYSSALQTPIAQGQEAEQLGQQQRVLAARAAIQQQFAPQPNETLAQQAGRLSNMGAALAANGDDAGAKAVAATAAALHARLLNAPRASTPIKVEGIDPKTKQPATLLVDPATGNVISSYLSPPKGEAELQKTQGSQLEALQRDYQGISKPYQASVSGYNELQGLLDSNAPPSSIIAAYARFINPGRAASAGVMGVLGDMGSVGTQLQNYYTKKTTGTLDPQIAAMMRRSADASMASLRAQNQNDVATTAQRGVALGLPSERVQGSLSVPKVQLYRERLGAVAPGRQTPFGVTQ